MKASINRVVDARSMELLWGYVTTVAGNALVAASDGRICAVDLHTGQHAEQQLYADWPAAVFRRDDVAVAALFAECGETPRLLLRGTDFQCAVWQALCAIPAGETRTYGELARALGRPGAARAVGSAAAANRIALLVPCHRLVPAAGGAGAFRWGADRKSALLAAESRENSIYGKNGTNKQFQAHIS